MRTSAFRFGTPNAEYHSLFRRGALQCKQKRPGRFCDGYVPRHHYIRLDRYVVLLIYSP